MTDIPATPRFSLPLLATAQAQKEVTHNEALALIDALIHPAVEAGPQIDPPTGPAVGACWLTGPAPTGAWAGQGGMLAVWTGGGWRFVQGRSGMRVWRKPDGALLRFDDGEWTVPAVVEPPEGGVVIDTEARSTLAALILHLGAQGLLISG